MILIVSADPVPILLLPEKQGNFHLNSLDDSAIKGIFFLLVLFCRLKQQTFLSISGKIPFTTNISEVR